MNFCCVKGCDQQAKWRFDTPEDWGYGHIHLRCEQHMSGSTSWLTHSGDVWRSKTGAVTYFRIPEPPAELPAVLRRVRRTL